MAELRLAESHLAAFLPGLTLERVTVWCAALNGAAASFEIHSRERWAAFLAQIAHESAGLTQLEERLSYSAERLCAVWPRRFPTLESARPYARNPEALANRVYANRMGNGAEATGDGWRFRGRGLIQLTGRSNYQACARGIGLAVDARPDWLLEPLAAALSAAWYWSTRGCNELADVSVENPEAFRKICQIVNGGLVGIEDRTRLWQLARQSLGV